MRRTVSTLSALIEFPLRYRASLSPQPKLGYKFLNIVAAV
jgi:hypothetical protein